MLYFFYGTDRKRARDAMRMARKKFDKDAEPVVVSDAHTPEDLAAALQGGGLFARKRTVLLDGVLQNPEMRAVVLEALPRLRDADEPFFILEEKPDTDARKRVEKYAERSEKFDLPGKGRDISIFAIGNALRSGDRKALWVALMRQLMDGTAPEAVHGVLFWAAKDMLLKAHGKDAEARAQRLVAQLAELPHESRRNDEELDYALERFVLSQA